MSKITQALRVRSGHRGQAFGAPQRRVVFLFYHVASFHADSCILRVTGCSYKLRPFLIIEGHEFGSYSDLEGNLKDKE